MSTDRKPVGGIDVGLKGAVALVSADGSKYEVHDIPTIKNGSKKEYDMWALNDLLKSFILGHGNLLFYVEKVGAMPGQGVTSMFRFGMGYGIAQMAVVGAGHRLGLVRPQTWKASTMRDSAKSKGASCAVAHQLFPRAELTGSRGGMKDGRCEALLIAEYARRETYGTV
tara:strand:+ start:485 stop:991 length:507 start_codon:yes stop_codon:yes gene_type:complete